MSAHASFMLAGSVLLAGGLCVLARLYWPLPWLKSRPVCGQRRVIYRQGRRIVTYAQGRGLRVAMLASVGRSVADFNELATSLVEAGFRTLSVEAPACGGTDPLREGTSLDDLAEDLVAAIMEDEKQSRSCATIGLGHGFGHRVVRVAAHRKAAMIKACILIAPGSKTSLTGSDAGHFRQCFNPVIRASVRLEHIRRIFFSKESEVPSHWRCGWHWRTARIQGSASAATPDPDWRMSGEGPVLLVQGADDRIAPHQEVADILRKELGDSRLEQAMVQKAGHALLPEQAISVARIVTDFLNQGFFSRKQQEIALHKPGRHPNIL